jgi:hypothetical protein
VVVHTEQYGWHTAAYGGHRGELGRRDDRHDRDRQHCRSGEATRGDRDSAAAGRRDASLTRVDAADTYTTPLRADDSREPAAWQAGLFAGIPGWVSALMGVRHVLVKPFGLETGGAKSLGDGFPVLSSSPTRIVMGIDDKHLDFRLVVDVDEPAGDVAFTTLVQIHGRSGRAYWAVVKHFHPVVMRSMMARIPSPATPA